MKVNCIQKDDSKSIWLQNSLFYEDFFVSFAERLLPSGENLIYSLRY